jgi:hypothetical protein
MHALAHSRFLRNDWVGRAILRGPQEPKGIAAGGSSMKPLSVFLGRLLGLFTIITVCWLLADRQATVSMIPVLLGDRAAIIVLAILSLGAGLAVVLAHNIWSGGLLPILVTAVGWLLLIRGVLFLFLSYREISRILEFMQFGTFFYVYLAIPLLLGVCLTYLGFTAHANR